MSAEPGVEKVVSGGRPTRFSRRYLIKLWSSLVVNDDECRPLRVNLRGALLRHDCLGGGSAPREVIPVRLGPGPGVGWDSVRVLSHGQREEMVVGSQGVDRPNRRV